MYVMRMWRPLDPGKQSIIFQVRREAVIDLKLSLHTHKYFEDIQYEA